MRVLSGRMIIFALAGYGAGYLLTGQSTVRPGVSLLTAALLGGSFAYIQHREDRPTLHIVLDEQEEKEAAAYGYIVGVASGVGVVAIIKQIFKDVLVM
eukprot:Clim_evm60s150 gene=Clim_evmTU60s150